MGILIDIILIVILMISIFLGYKKGLVKLGTQLFAGLIAIIITVILYKPVAEFIIRNTPIDDQIKSMIVENTTETIDKNLQNQNDITNQVKNEILPEQAANLSKNIVYAITSIILFIFVKIILSIVISLMDFVAGLPILKQFNEVGGMLYGLLRGILIIAICILLLGGYTKIKPGSKLNDDIQDSHLTKIIYESIVKLW